VILLALLLVVPAAEVFVFIEVGLAIGWLAALALLLGTSALGVVLLRLQARSVIRRASPAIRGRRAPGIVAIDAALGFLGCLLLVVPGFITDALGALLVLAPTRALLGRSISRRLARRLMGFAAAAERLAPRGRGPRPADVEGTAVEDDPERPRLT
jgi:UPF0716 protein FxsA